MEETIPEDVRAAAMKAQNDAMERCKKAGLAAYEYPYASGRAKEVLDEEISRAILAERERCAKLIEEGFDRPVGERYADDPSVRSKNDKCPHGRYMYEDCEQCAAQAIRSGV